LDFTPFLRKSAAMTNAMTEEIEAAIAGDAVFVADFSTLAAA